MNDSIFIKEIKSLNKTFPLRKLQSQIASPVNSSRCLRKITLSQTHLENRGDTLNTFLMPTYPWYQCLTTFNKKKTYRRPLSLKNIKSNILNKILPNPNNDTWEGNCIVRRWVYYKNTKLIEHWKTDSCNLTF